jgi:hypothetical protein
MTDICTYTGMGGSWYNRSNKLSFSSILYHDTINRLFHDLYTFLGRLNRDIFTIILNNIIDLKKYVMYLNVPLTSNIKTLLPV